MLVQDMYGSAINCGQETSHEDLFTLLEHFLLYFNTYLVTAKYICVIYQLPPTPQCFLSDIYDYVGGSCSSSRPYHAT